MDHGMLSDRSLPNGLTHTPNVHTPVSAGEALGGNISQEEQSPHLVADISQILAYTGIPGPLLGSLRAALCEQVSKPLCPLLNS